MADRNPNAAILSQSVAHQHGLIRYANGVGNDLSGVLSDGDRELMKYLAGQVRELLRLTPVIQRQRFLDLSAALADINTAIYQGATDAMLRAMAELIPYEAEFQSSMLAKAAGADVAVTIPQAAQESILHAPYVGRTIQQQLEDAAAARAQQISREIGKAIQGAPDLQQILDAIEGGPDGPGILGRARDWLHTLAQTDTAGVADQAGREVYHSSGVVRAELWVSVLDARTTPLCQTNDGSTRTLGSDSWSNGYSGPVPPAHFACRSVVIPMIQGAPDPNKLTYAEWLAEQSPEEQQQILGVKRYALYAQGRLPLDRFVNDRGEQYSLQELAQRERDAWKRAGLAA